MFRRVDCKKCTDDSDVCTVITIRALMTKAENTYEMPVISSNVITLQETVIFINTAVRN
jgi:hypothetical protein